MVYLQSFHSTTLDLIISSVFMYQCQLLSRFILMIAMTLRTVWLIVLNVSITKFIFTVEQRWIANTLLMCSFILDLFFIQLDLQVLTLRLDSFCLIKTNINLDISKELKITGYLCGWNAQVNKFYLTNDVWNWIQRE